MSGPTFPVLKLDDLLKFNRELLSLPQGPSGVIFRPDDLTKVLDGLRAPVPTMAALSPAKSIFGIDIFICEDETIVARGDYAIVNGDDAGRAWLREMLLTGKVRRA